MKTSILIYDSHRFLQNGRGKSVKFHFEQPFIIIFTFFWRSISLINCDVKITYKENIAPDAWLTKSPYRVESAAIVRSREKKKLNITRRLFNFGVKELRLFLSRSDDKYKTKKVDSWFDYHDYVRLLLYD